MNNKKANNDDKLKCIESSVLNIKFHANWNMLYSVWNRMRDYLSEIFYEYCFYANHFKMS